MNAAYDAHGIDHTLLLSVKMYAVGRRPPFRAIFSRGTQNACAALVHKLERERDM